MADMADKVMIACPVRNRAWVLPRYLASLKQLDYPESQREYLFIINDCIDETPQILEDFARREKGRVRLIYCNLGHKYGHLRGQYNFSHLALLRNRLLESFLKSDAAYLFSVDSDILLPAKSLSLLMQDNCDIVSALVCNGEEVGDNSIYNILLEDAAGNLRHCQGFPRDRVFPVDCTGAAYLIKRKVIEPLGVRYSERDGAEDIGFCRQAREKGISIFCDGRIECIHLMREDTLPASLAAKKIKIP
ncbi:MAG: glycosyltransferase family 2 protein [Syntrophomonas sp.]|uniref:glycosyltransferase n=1 Tax=Syntrophomonas sp. TaxID=2053627 RepID=UPI0026262E90|nr:glycosyltransferase family 2 protein [Syntrophomonas sp.]MDD2510531.1 glycosyltransferase family 2 protein [Syntrophomonas sp.]MDD3879900.1 glycosyltransferase family 2 protein [Syntrophomonas sp.]MDD4626352.1 glycosyltransferase family 2 protein [Syntrophomonas sp.]